MGFIVNNSQPFTVLQVIPRLVSGGAERSAVDVAAALIKQGHKAIVISEGGRLVEELRRIGAIHIQLPVSSKSPWRIYRNISKIGQVIKKHKVDIIHSRSRAPAWSAYYAARRSGEDVKVVSTYHGLYGESNIFKKIYNKIMVRGDAVIGVSDFVSEQIRLRYPDYADRVHVVKRGVNLVHYAPELVTRQRIEQLLKQWSVVDDLRNVIMLPGRITRIKGHLVLVEAVKKLLKKRNDFLCICPGDIQKGKDGYAERVLGKIRKANLEPYILLPGGCLDMPAAYAISNIVVAPSTKPESFGRVPVEAQLMGKPIVASRHGGFCETIEEGETGFLFDVDDADSLADALDKALSLSEEKRIQMASIGRKRVTEMYSVTRMCEETLNVYKNIMTA